MSHPSLDSLPSELLKDGIVEVRGDNGAFYKAFIVDIDDATNEMNNCLDADSAANSTSNAVSNSCDASKILLAFENDWLPQQKFPINRIRLPPPSPPSHTSTGSPSSTANQTDANLTASTANSITANASNSVVSVPPIITEGMEIEVLSCTNEGEQCGWWRAQVKMIKGRRMALTMENPLGLTNSNCR